MRQGASVRPTDGTEGFTLVESVVALMVVSATLLVLGPVLFHVANQRTKDEGVIERDALLRSEANRLSSLAFKSLDAQIGCTTDSDADLPHTRCVGVTSVSFSERTVKIIVAPTSARVPRDSVVLTRTSARGNPFNTALP